MKKLLFLAISLSLLSCKNEPKKLVVAPIQIKPTETPYIEPKLVDSALYYFTKEMDCKMVADSCRTRYYRDEKESTRVYGNLYVDSIHYYSVKLSKYAGQFSSKPDGTINPKNDYGTK